MVEAPVGYQCPICTGRAREGAMGAASYRARSATSRRVNRFPLAVVLRGAGMSQILIGANVAVFIGMVLTGQAESDRTLLRFGALPPVLRHAEWWRLFTAMFVHVGPLHLAFNMFALALFGPAIEGRYGRTRFLLLYLASGFLGGAASLMFTGGGIRAGASGGVFGILGAWIAFFVRHRDLRGAREQLRSLFFLVGINLFLGAAIGGIDNFAHLGGLVGGFVAGTALELSARVRGPGRRIAGLGGYAVVLLAGMWMLFASGRFV